jgi:hypothetical protein
MTYTSVRSQLPEGIACGDCQALSVAKVGSEWGFPMLWGRNHLTAGIQRHISLFAK